MTESVICGDSESCFRVGGDAVLFELVLGTSFSGLVEAWNAVAAGLCLGLRAYRGPLGPVFFGTAR